MQSAELHRQSGHGFKVGSVLPIPYTCVSKWDSVLSEENSPAKARKTAQRKLGKRGNRLPRDKTLQSASEQEYAQKTANPQYEHEFVSSDFSIVILSSHSLRLPPPPNL